MAVIFSQVMEMAGVVCKTPSRNAKQGSDYVPVH